MADLGVEVRLQFPGGIVTISESKIFRRLAEITRDDDSLAVSLKGNECRMSYLDKRGWLKNIHGDKDELLESVADALEQYDERNE